MMKRSVSKGSKQKDSGMLMIKAWKESSLNQRQYCLKKGIPYHHFHYWYKRFRNQEASSSFIPVHIEPGVTGSVELIWLDGKRILFHQPVSSDYLKALLN